MVLVIFTIVSFWFMALFTLLIAIEAPKGEASFIKSTWLPGIMTPNTMESPENWKRAHRVTAPYFIALSIYYVLAGIVNVLLIVLHADVDYKTVITWSFMLSIAFWVIIVCIGDRAVSPRQNEKRRNNGK